MSWASKFIFDPIVAAAARARTSSNPVAQQVGQAAQQAIQQIAVDASGGSLSQNSAVAVGNTLVADFENGLKGVVDSLVYGLITSAAAGGGPVAQAAVQPIAQDAVAATNVALDFLEQHGLTYISALFAHHRANVSPDPAKGA